MKDFYDEESFLWRNLIGETLDKRLREDEYKSYETKIEKEISYLEEMKNFSWPENSYNEFQNILILQLEEIRDKIDVEQKNAELINVKKELENMKKEVLNLPSNRGLEVFKDEINKKIRNLF